MSNLTLITGVFFAITLAGAQRANGQASSPVAASSETTSAHNSTTLSATPPFVSGNRFELIVKQLADQDPVVQDNSYYRLLQSSSTALPDILAAMHNPNPTIRKTCILLLEDIRDPRAVSTLQSTSVSDDDWQIRQSAVRSLARFKTAQSSATFVDVAMHDPVINVRIAAVEQLGLSEGVSIIPFMKELMHDQHVMVASEAALVLAQKGDASGYQMAKQLLDAKAWQIRAVAISVLGYAGLTRDISVLEEIAHDSYEHPLVRQRALFAENHINLISLRPEQQQEMLRNSMADPNQSTRLWAASELVARNDEFAVNLLRNIASDNHHSGKTEASGALSQLVRDK